MEKQLDLQNVKEINGYKIYIVIKDDYTPDNVGMIIFHTPEGKEYPCNSVEEAESIIIKMSSKP